MAHYDIASDIAAMAAMPPGPSGLHPWNDVLVRLSRVPVLTVASIGAGRGGGQRVLARMRRALCQPEKAILGQWEVGAGAVPGGGPMARLSRLVGRGRALEILIGSDDFAGDLAERYGYVNRAVPDAELDTFVETFARRIAGFEKEAIPIENYAVNRRVACSLSNRIGSWAFDLVIASTYTSKCSSSRRLL